MALGPSPCRIGLFKIKGRRRSGRCAAPRQAARSVRRGRRSPDGRAGPRTVPRSRPRPDRSPLGRATALTNRRWAYEPVWRRGPGRDCGRAPLESSGELPEDRLIVRYWGTPWFPRPLLEPEGTPARIGLYRVAHRPRGSTLRTGADHRPRGRLVA
jgi:hypothetical protein